MSLVDPFAPAQAVADAVLYEGYVLYPYRASADKNRIRWQWGVVGTEGAHAAGVGEASTMATDLLVEGADTAIVRLRLRFLRVVARRIERHDGDAVEEVPLVTIDGQTHVTFDDAEEQTVDVAVAVGSASGSDRVRFEIEPTTALDQLGQVDGVAYRRARRGERLHGELAISWEEWGPGVRRLTLHLRNITPWSAGDRDDANRRSFVGAHVLGSVTDGLFVSTTDPPEALADAAAACEHDRLWPVVIGAPRRAALVLASPVILYDQPEIAPESQGSFYDGLEIDELLSLRVLTMTDEEKAEARATDPRSAAIVDRVEAMEPEDLARLHGTIRGPVGRVDDPDIDVDDVPVIVGDGTDGAAPPDVPWWDPGADSRFDPATDGVVVAGTPISRGSVVRLQPGARADAHDIFYRDREATVAAVLHDVDGSIHIAVTIDDDPAADLYDATGRYLYFGPDEIEPLGRRLER